MSAFLTAAELQQLTGYVKSSKQIQWLTRHGVPHLVNAAGRPVVLSDVLDKRPVTAFELGTVR